MLTEEHLHEALAPLDFNGKLSERIIYRVALCRPDMPLWFTPPNRNLEYKLARIFATKLVYSQENANVRPPAKRLVCTWK